MDRFTWGVVAGAVVLVVAGLVSVLLLPRTVPPPDLTRPEGVVRTYVQAMDDGRPEDAWDLLATSARAGVTRDEFIRRATTFRRGQASRLAFEQVDVSPAAARVELARTYSGGGGLFGPSSYTERSTVRLDREDGAWRITVPPDAHLLDRTFP
jgi:hypothetical protein